METNSTNTDNNAEKPEWFNKVLGYDDPPPAPWYDRVDGIAAKCGNISDFHLLLDARREACRTKEGKRPVLNRFIVNGQWMLDEFGQLMSIVEVRDTVAYKVIEKEKWPVLPTVVKADDFIELIANHFKPKLTYSYGTGGGLVTPYHVVNGSCCDTCKKTILFDDIDALARKSRTDYYPAIAEAHIGSLAGKTEKELTELLSKHYKALVHVYMTDGPEDEKTMDFYSVFTVEHKECRNLRMTFNTRESFINAIAEAGVEVYGTVRTKNEYGSEDYNGPWFIVDTSIGILTIGWRKNVINIDYKQIDPEYVSNSERTNGPGYEHANNYEEVTGAIRLFIHLQKSKEMSNELHRRG